MTSKGSCLCGQITYEISGSPAATALCHCNNCQKASGSAFTSNIVLEDSQFKQTSGTPKTYEAIGNSGKVNKHFFCGNCGSSLWNKLDVMEGKTVVRAGGVNDGGADFKDVAVEFYTKDRVSYVDAKKDAKQEHMFG